MMSYYYCFLVLLLLLRHWWSISFGIFLSYILFVDTQWCDSMVWRPDYIYLCIHQLSCSYFSVFSFYLYFIFYFLNETATKKKWNHSVKKNWHLVKLCMWLRHTSMPYKILKSKPNKSKCRKDTKNKLRIN